MNLDRMGVDSREDKKHVENIKVLSLDLEWRKYVYYPLAHKEGWAEVPVEGLGPPHKEASE